MSCSRVSLICLLGLLLGPAVHAQSTHRESDVGSPRRSEWLLTASPVGASHTRWMGDRVGIGVVLTGPVLGWEVGSEGGHGPDYVASAALALEVKAGSLVFRGAPAAVVLTGNDWGQVYPGYHAGVRTYVRLGRLDVSFGAEMVGVRIAGGNGTGEWRAKVGPLIGVRL